MSYGASSSTSKPTLSSTKVTTGSSPSFFAAGSGSGGYEPPKPQTAKTVTVAKKVTTPVALPMCYPTSKPIPYESSSSGLSKKTSPTPAPVVSPKPTLAPIYFNVLCTGLKPDTVHKFYYEGIDVTDYCKLQGASVATSNILKTNSSGSITFDFNYETKIEKYVDGLNEVNYDLAGDKKFELRATGSAASKIIPFKY